ncbi:MAG: ferrous iron transport protein A [Deltaproteobacteria bacterium]|nr:ferrous iron transport protein A [Deltaproteobacteria bacterium]MBW2084009.1 ferrous iron transport protein A [Deltaproteobacteria bacterium]
MGLSLREMEIGSKGRVKGYREGAKPYLDKLLAMGLTIGAEFTVSRVAPLGDPVELNVRGYDITLRKNEAEILIVERR